MKKTRYSSHWLGGGLLRQITVLALLTTTVLLTLFGWQRISSGNDRLTRNLHLTLETNSQWLATSLGLPLYNFDDATVTAICNSMLNHPDISQITVQANGQTQTFSAVDVVDTKQLSDDDISISNDITHYSLTLGRVEVYVSTKNLQQQIRAAGWTTLVQIVLLNFFLVAALLFLISRSFIKPMAQLQQASDRIAEGDLQHPIKIKSSNELGILANNLETMRMTLQGKISALETEVEMRSKIEKELTQTKNYIDNIINSMPSLLISVDNDLKVTQWNRRAEELSGVAEEDAIGKKIDELCPGLAGEKGRISEAINQRQVLHEDARISKKNNVLQYEDVTIYPLVTNGDVGAVVRVDDVTEEFQLRNELAHVRKLDAIGQLAGGVAHDFNNMLGGILGGAELLKRYIGDHEKGRQYLDVIIQSGNRASELTE
ncbi:MAG: HAMP domain-containing protein, partial [Desulfuromusa sp.]|nr:HAMP domain-containing protein [Desulfuromusa sp.]